MNESRDIEFRDKLRETFNAGLPEDVVKPLAEQIEGLFRDAADKVEWWLKDDLADQLMYYVQEMTDRAIESMLSGNEEMFRRYLGCEKYGYTGRDRGSDVIHGRLFETGGIQKRHELVDAFADLLKNERILDLESHVKGLTELVNKKDRETELLRERLR
jgi:hypothetical protein